MIMYILLVSFLIILLFLIVTTPVTFRRVRPGDNYKVGNTLHTIPEIKIHRPVFYLKEDVLCKMGHLLAHLHKILADNNIPYWITCGTLLGCARHQGFIPWDDDIDINIELGYVNQLVDVLEKHENDEYLLCKARGGYKFGYNIFPLYPFVDIVMVNNDNGVFRLCYPLDENGQCTYEVGNQWPDECFAESDVYPLVKRKFEDFEVSVPNQHIKLLQRIYGNDCLDAAGSRGGIPYAYSIKSIPWLMNHYYDNIMFRLGLHKG